MSLYTDLHQHPKAWQTTIPPARDDASSVSRSPRACILLASSGLEPREVINPWEYLINHGFFVEFATWDGKPAIADPTLLSHTLFGSKYSIQARWKDFITLSEWLQPKAWAPLNGTPLTLDSYDLIYIPGGWATREHLEKDTKLHEMISKYTLHIQRTLGAKVLAVSGDGIAPLQNVTHPLTQAPLLSMLSSTGPGYDSWSGILTGKDLGSSIPKLVKTYTNRAVVTDPDNWYISSPSGAWSAELSAGMIALTRNAIKVDEIRKIERTSKRLTTAQSRQLQSSLEFDGLTARQKERLDVDGIGKQNTGFVLSQWSWGWRKALD